MKLLIFVFCYSLSNSVALEWPSYVPKCSFKSPDLNQCLIEKANIVIPQLAKGDSALKIPVLAPIHVPQAKLEGKNLKISASDVYGYGLETFKLTDALLDLKNNEGYFKMATDEVTVKAKYSIDNSTVLGRSLSGEGHMNFTFVNVKVLYEGRPTTTERDGEPYFKIENPKVSFVPEKASFFFENLRSPNEGDATAFVNKNWKAVFDELQPSFELLLLQYTNLCINAFAQNFPIKTLFLP